ncbi:protein brawnin [Anthonomus grandis grandis]|uniref:protein brawnin n=1 Tax=Anthonomus grandis grandis TaxID=2921223 RepID=UPI0021651304|nr:protein brawnin [Anthonomus grandis grandis]
MPAGVSWGQYLKFSTCALLSMFAGSQLVHIYYRPLDDINKYVEKLEQEQKVTK